MSRCERAGESEFRHTHQVQTLGDTTDEVVEELLKETFEKYVSGVIGVLLPGPLTYATARTMMSSAGGRGTGVQIAALWEGADLLTNDLTVDASITPASLFGDAFATGLTGYSTDMRIPVSKPLQDGANLDVGAYGPSFYISEDPEPVCIDADRRTLTVKGQLTGGPVILMGLDSELVPGSSGHGPPEEHAKMVASILESVTNDGESILVLGGDPDSNPDIRAYWEDDVASDPRIDEDVTFVNGPEYIREVDFDGYAMIGIVSSTGQIGHGLVDSENQALIDRQHDIAEFVNAGGGLLGKTQDGLDDSWDYISEIADIDPIETGFSSVDVTPAGEELGLTQSGMDGWCCYHESFAEDSVPDFLNVLIRNAQRSDRPPAAVGGDSVVIQTAVDLEVNAPGVVTTGEFGDLEVRIANRVNERGEAVRLEVEITRAAGISEGDVELADGRSLEPSGEALTTQLTDDPVEFPPDLDTTVDLNLAFHEAGPYNLQVDVVNDEADETIVSLPFGIRALDTDLETCD